MKKRPGFAHFFKKDHYITGFQFAWIGFDQTIPKICCYLYVPLHPTEPQPLPYLVPTYMV